MFYSNIKRFYKIIICLLSFLFILFLTLFLLINFEIIPKSEKFNIQYFILIVLIVFILFLLFLYFLIYKERNIRKQIPINEINFKFLEKLLNTNKNTLIVFDHNYCISWTNNEKLLKKILKLKNIDKLYGTKLEEVFKDKIEDIKDNKMKSFFKEFDILEENYFNITQVKPHVIVLKSFSNFKKTSTLLKEREMFIFFVSIDDEVLLGEDYELFNSQKKQISVFVEFEMDQILSNKNIILQTRELGEFVFFSSRKSLNEIIEQKFSFIKHISEKVKKQFGIEITFSVGFYLTFEKQYNLEEPIENWEFETVLEKYKKSLNALNIAKKRGGDQVVSLYSDQTFKTYGKERRKTKIIPEVKNIQNAFWKTISDYKDILIVGHKNADFDSIGSGIALKYLLEKVNLNIKVKFIINEYQKNVINTMSQIIGETNLNQYISFNFDLEKWSKRKTKNKLIIIIDNNNPDYIDLPIKVQEKFNKICIDHHVDSNKMQNILLNLIKPNFSSTSEIIMFLILSKFQKNEYIIPSFIYKSLLMGILLDTNNLQVNVNKNTVLVIEFITRHDIDIQTQIDILKTLNKKKVDESKKFNDFSIKLFDEKIAILYKEDDNSKTQIVASIANDFLNNYQIETVFVIAGNENKVFVSARSLKEFNVQIVCRELGGGGAKDRAAAIVEKKNVVEVVRKILSILKK